MRCYAIFYCALFCASFSPAKAGEDFEPRFRRHLSREENATNNGSARKEKEEQAAAEQVMEEGEEEGIAREAAAAQAAAQAAAAAATAAAMENPPTPEFSRAVLRSNAAGFLYVRAIDWERRTISFLSPCNPPLPSRILIMGSIKYYDE